MYLVYVANKFLGKHRAENFRELVDGHVEAYRILHAHLEFKDNMGDYSEEQGERFYQDVRSFEERYKGQYNGSMMRDYIWKLLRESELTCCRQSQKNISF